MRYDIIIALKRYNELAKVYIYLYCFFVFVLMVNLF